jgi:hypothetical protein
MMMISIPLKSDRLHAVCISDIQNILGSPLCDRTCTGRIMAQLFPERKRQVAAHKHLK